MNQLCHYFNENNYLSEEHYAWISERSELAELKLEDFLFNELGIGNTPININFDLSKAVDSLHYKILLYTLNTMEFQYWLSICLKTI